MVKLSASLFSSVLLLVLPAISLAVPLRQRSLESESDIYGRAVAQIEDYITAREHYETLYGRELGDLEKREVVKFLYRREPFLWFHPGVGIDKHETKKDEVRLAECKSELEGLQKGGPGVYPREPILGFHLGKTSKAAANDEQTVAVNLASCQGALKALKAPQGQGQ